MKTWAYLKQPLLILTRVKQSKSASLKAAKTEEEDHAAEIRVRKYEEEMQFEKEKLEQRLKYEKQIEDSRKDQNKNDKSISAKLPKLLIDALPFNSEGY